MELKKNDLIFFQNEVLKDLKELEKRINDKIIALSNKIIQQTSFNEETITSQNNQIMKILNLVSSNEETIKINLKLSNFQNKIDNFIFLINTKISSLEKNLSDICYKYDKIFITNLTSQGLIGPSCEYSNVRIFLESVDKKIKELSTIKDKQNKDIKMYKDKLESLIGQFKIQAETINNKMTLFCNELLEKFEKKNDEKIKSIEERVNNMRIENGEYSFKLLKKTDDLNIEWEKIREIKNEIFNRFDMSLDDFKNENKNLIKEFEIYKKEHKLIKNKFTELSEFIKDVRFRNTMKNLSNYKSKKMFNEMSQKIDFSKKGDKNNEDIFFDYDLFEDNPNIIKRRNTKVGNDINNNINSNNILNNNNIQNNIDNNNNNINIIPNVNKNDNTNKNIDKSNDYTIDNYLSKINNNKNNIN